MANMPTSTLSASFHPTQRVRAPKKSTSAIPNLMSRILSELGEDTSREGLLDTPKRYEKAMRKLTSGYGQDPYEIVGKALFKEDHHGIVLVKNIELFSLCEHHLLPFFGAAHIAYIPDGKVIGLSKIPRLVEAFARRLQVQERLTTQVAHALQEVLKPKGVAVMIEASHMCMMMRGVEKQLSRTRTSVIEGDFRSDPALRQELFSMLGSQL